MKKCSKILGILCAAFILVPALAHANELRYVDSTVNTNSESCTGSSCDKSAKSSTFIFRSNTGGSYATTYVDPSRSCSTTAVFNNNWIITKSTNTCDPTTASLVNSVLPKTDPIMDDLHVKGMLKFQKDDSTDPLWTETLARKGQTSLTFVLDDARHYSTLKLAVLVKNLNYLENNRGVRIENEPYVPCDKVKVGGVVGQGTSYCYFFFKVANGKTLDVTPTVDSSVSKLYQYSFDPLHTTVETTKEVALADDASLADASAQYPSGWWKNLVSWFKGKK